MLKSTPTQSFRHGRNTCHSVKVTGGPASSPPLDLLNLFSFHFSMGVPNGCSIFALWPDQGIVGGLSHSGHFCSDFSFYEAEGFVCSVGYSVHVQAPGQVAGNVDPQVLSTADCFEDLPMQSMQTSTNGIPGTSHLYHLTFWGVEFHVQGNLPPGQSIQILL